ncbi:unnamed protein product [Gongylonema pulchrum]|uniref:Secreted protein n=1 Tax=Gongylonema pulchrum TaxID=637853 RepID=A0A183DDL1_9BILA|nr:unnamed protein product [Gongylonema pulchrum]
METAPLIVAAAVVVIVAGCCMLLDVRRNATKRNEVFAARCTGHRRRPPAVVVASGYIGTANPGSEIIQTINPIKSAQRENWNVANPCCFCATALLARVEEKTESTVFQLCRLSPMCSIAQVMSPQC